jgi:putative membrane protein
MSGPAFDREFVRYMIEDHRKDIHAFEATKVGLRPDGELARQTLPALRKHLEMAEQLQP